MINRIKSIFAGLRRRIMLEGMNKYLHNKHLSKYQQSYPKHSLLLKTYRCLQSWNVCTYMFVCVWHTCRTMWISVLIRIFLCEWTQTYFLYKKNHLIFSGHTYLKSQPCISLPVKSHVYRPRSKVVLMNMCLSLPIILHFKQIAIRATFFSA